ncbi:MAG TPA: bifunctional 23S rRNA (guanine(2069)-N(7))-methyltransferase RlmK/23S rRNA (guanine(2445)-N(2))-methyltransferase RlmL [Steroidobacteraceae bacterium]|nr:bifunctional 23S rRNA (guanine(2069)-N(7))-methyltransferase RlmK/23S rRNA (guanine(2445)-N(2))-methyltransferase RlmL [Steroidobacteraceae bacterium]
MAIAPRGLADLLSRELGALGAERLMERGTGVQFDGPLEAGYRACLWSRTASRVLLQLFEVEADSADEFYRAAEAFDWSVHVDPARTLACEFSGTHPAITNTHFGALRLKDAVCDRLRAQTGARPSISLTRPAVRLHAHARGTRVTLSLDMAGEGLHRRGYRLDAGEAPLRENLAAGVLLRAGWEAAAGRGAEFLDPMCGSGTLVIEAAMIAARRAPGLARDYFGFLGWRQHQSALWQGLCDEARALAAGEIASVIRGSDIDQRALGMAATNAQRAGVAQLVRFEHRPVASVRPLGGEPGLVCTNPPYGERLGDTTQARLLHAELGSALREHFAGWDAAILSAAPEAARELKLRSYRVHELWNGAIACRLLRIDLAAPGAQDLQSQQRQRAAEAAASPGAQMFANRLEKNLKRLDKLARRAGVSCYRLYDADMPEYAFAVDRYVELDGGAAHLHVQEYAPPASIDAQAARRRRHEVLATLPRVLAVPPERIHLRRREPQRGTAQYQPRRRETNPRAQDAGGGGRDGGGGADGSGRGGGGTGGGGFVVGEGGLKFLVNLDDYLDTGLFLDHRLTRARLGERSRDARVLNLFCYTASASVYAAAAGALETVSVDLSNRYLDWAAENFRLNGLDPARHRLERADCREWLRRADGPAAQPFDLIFLDPPTFSNSKRMQGVLDVQRDHLQLVESCMQWLAPGGLLLFSTNAQHFRLEPQVAERWRVTDVSRATLPFDFERNPRIHRCFEITRP